MKTRKFTDYRNYIKYSLNVDINLSFIIDLLNEFIVPNSKASHDILWPFSTNPLELELELWCLCALRRCTVK